MKFQISSTILAAAHLAAAAGAGIPPAPKPESVVAVGVQKSTSADVGRDLGFSGKVGDTIINTYGDTARCGLPPPWQDGCGYPGASNSMSKGDSSNPLSVTDYQHFLQDGWVQQFCNTYPDEPRTSGQFAVGITNVLPVSETEGMLFWLLNNRTDTHLNNFPGSGVARVSLNNGTPICTRLQNDAATGRDAQHWWGPTEPAFGDHAAFLGNDGYLYGMGGMSNAATGANKSLNNFGLFMTRVKQAQYADWSAYEYWHGEQIGWSPDRLYNPPIEARVLPPNAGQGSMFYSPHFGGYLFMYSMNGALVVRLAYSPTGPWSDDMNGIYDMHCASFGCSYSPSMMPWWDESGKTLYVQYSHAGTYDIDVIKITWAGNGAQSANAFPYSANFQINTAAANPSTNSSKVSADDEAHDSTKPSIYAQPAATSAAIMDSKPVASPAATAIAPPQPLKPSRIHGHGGRVHGHANHKLNTAAPAMAQGSKIPDVFSTECTGCEPTVTITVTKYVTPTAMPS